MKVMKPMKMAIKVHKDMCDGSGLMLNINKKQENIHNPYYSMVHTIEEGFVIITYSCTQKTKMRDGCVHRKYTVRLILSIVMATMWYKSSYHSAEKSRKTPSGMIKEGLRLFMYLWPFIEKINEK